jgi:APA family basic amino acid/polyamine antiporter
MARDGHLPSLLTAVGATRRVPWAAEIVAGAVVVVLVLTGDLVSSIGFSSFCVLVYYAVANASALTLPSGGLVRAGSALGLAGCVVLAALLPAASVMAGALVVACGAVAYLTRRRGGASRQT